MADWISQLKDYTFLVTGSAGFIGYHVALTLLGCGARVVGLDNFNDYYSPALKHDRDRELRRHPNFVSVTAELADLPALEALFQSPRGRWRRLRPDLKVTFVALTKTPLTEAGKFPHPVIALISAHTFVEFVPWQKVHQLGENGSS